MIIDTDRSTGKQERRYLIYDMMGLNQESVAEVRYKYLYGYMFGRLFHLIVYHWKVLYVDNCFYSKFGPWGRV